ncbi:MAG: methyl-accepting chemotaxis protein [Beijerinckiaceae bacterium]
MTLQRMGLLGNLCLVHGTTFIVWMLSTIAFPDHLATGLIGLALLLASFFAYSRLCMPFNRMRRRMGHIARLMAEDEAQARAQHSLDRNIDLLHERLYALGQPRRAGEDLFFGRQRINGNLEHVDFVKAQAGGTATIFAGDLRVATNVLRPDGTRAIGTQLARGPVYDRIFEERKTYRGEADILGVSYLAVYEPIISGTEVVGILFVGVPKAKCKLDDNAMRGAEGNAFAEMERIIATLEKAAMAKAKAEREAAEQRHEADDARRQHEAANKAAAALQSEIVTLLSIALERLAAGDLTHRVLAKFPPDYAKLKEDFNFTCDQLHETVALITRNAQSMQAGSEQISHSAVDLARRTEEQAQALEETSAALSRLTETVNETAQGAQRASAIVTSTRSKTDWSRDVMNDAVAAMGEIDKSASEIGQIIGVIDEIALQTNLLALNAGVEAARAGDAGKGFAVIASEVRELARRSAEAAKQIKTLVATSAANVETGARLVGETSKGLGELLTQVAEISAVVADIATSAKTQADGLAQINGAVAAMDRVTQQNHAMVEDNKAASQELATEAETLAQLMSSFTIDDGMAAAGSAARGMARTAAQVQTSGPLAKLRRARANI